MNPDHALHMLSTLLWTGLLLCAPILGLTLLVGLVVSVLQVVTQVHDASLTFIPKLVTAALVTLAFGGWMLRELMQYATRLWTSIPSLF
ncbi:flagellar biosynthetic protein FliQ [Ramlibacter sp.]|uniref:flagellar biosynthetic protein FliQ n=1 Tax=Ramlibacter sp. TaxID=1917967 RepID=UPI003D151B5C